MKKFIFIISVAWVAFYAVLWAASKMIDYSNHQEYLSYMKIMDEIEQDNDNL